MISIVRHASAIFALALTVVTGAAADVSGTWDVDGDVVGNPVKFTCALKQDGDKLTGTAVLQGTEVQIQGGVKERVVTFQFDVDYQGTRYTDVFTGTLGDGDESIAGTIAVAGVEGRFTARKQKGK